MPAIIGVGRSGGMADAGDSKSPALHGRVGSTPTSGTRSSWRKRAADPSRDNLCACRAGPTGTHCQIRSSPGGSRSSSSSPVSPLPRDVRAAIPPPPLPPRPRPRYRRRLPADPGSRGLSHGTGVDRSREKAGSTPPLAHNVDPAPAPVAGLVGTPGASPGFGPENAPVRIFLFTDFQCGVCPRVVEPLKHLARAYPDDVRIVLKQNALATHGRAARLARLFGRLPAEQVLGVSRPSLREPRTELGTGSRRDRPGDRSRRRPLSVRHGLRGRDGAGQVRVRARGFDWSHRHAGTRRQRQTREGFGQLQGPRARRQIGDRARPGARTPGRTRRPRRV